MRPTLARAARPAAVLALLALAACPSKGTDVPAPPPAPSVAAAPIASARPAASAPAASSAIAHAPGTVPTAKPVAAKLDASAPPAPSFTRLEASPKRAGLDVVGARFTARGELVVRVTGAQIVVDPDTGAGMKLGPEGDLLELTADGALAALGTDASALVFDRKAGALRATIPGETTALAFSPDGKRLAIGGRSDVRVVDAADGHELAKGSVDGGATEIAFGPGDTLAVVESVVSVKVLSASTGAEKKGGGPAETTGTFGLVTSPDGRFAAAGSPAGHGLEVFTIGAWGPRRLVTIPEGACEEHVGPAFSADGKRVFAFGGQRWVKAFDVPSWKPYASFHAPPGRVVVSASDDLARVVVTRDEGAGAVVVTVGTGKETPLEGAFAKDASYALSADGARVVGWAGGALRVWDAKTGKGGIAIGP